MTTQELAPLVEATRSRSGEVGHIETQHFGVVCVTAGDGSPIAVAGNPELTSPLRSTAKAFQLLPFVLANLHHTLPEGRVASPDGTRESAPGLADLAVMMSSHNGEPMHTQRIAELLACAGLSPADLRCGVHPPLHQPAFQQLIRDHQEPGPLHCNCSGKHTNMLLVCKAHDWSLDTYLDIEHPLQRTIEDIISTLSGEPNPLPYVTDGCSLPTFVVSMSGLARLFSYLAWPVCAPTINAQSITQALQLLFHASVTYPEMIAGTSRLDTELMQAFDGTVFAKTGAAGVYAMAVKPNERYKTGLAIAIKVADGDANSAVRRITALEALKQLGLISPVLEGKLDTLAARTLNNFRNLPIGELRPVFTLVQ